MADLVNYPQIPSTVWSGIWRILHESPSRKIDDNVLAVELNVQRTAAKQYLKELQKVGLFGDDNSLTDLAKKWRQNGDDAEVISHILQTAYPDELREIAPIGKLDREKIVRWFVTQGLGLGAAKNKAATYMRVASGVSAVEQREPASGEKRPRTAVRRKSSASARPTPNAIATNDDGASGDDDRDSNGGDRPERRVRSSDRSARPELAVNVQIHISADSTADQIDAIFLAMRKYFDGRESD